MHILYVRENLSMHISLSEIIIVIIAGVVIAGRTPNMSNADVCGHGYSMASEGKYKEAIPLLTSCLESNDIQSDMRRQTFEARAWAYSNLENPKAAVADQEAAFAIAPAGSHREFINYASYLRSAGRAADSLVALKSAEIIDGYEGGVSMMTQFNLGWTLQELGRHEDAIDAFSKGIPTQPDYPFVYYRRGLSLEALGRINEARIDFEKLAELINKTSGTNVSSGKYIPQIREKLKKYGFQ